MTAPSLFLIAAIIKITIPYKKNKSVITWYIVTVCVYIFALVTITMMLNINASAIEIQTNIFFVSCGYKDQTNNVNKGTVRKNERYSSFKVTAHEIPVYILNAIIRAAITHDNDIS